MHAPPSLVLVRIVCGGHHGAAIGLQPVACSGRSLCLPTGLAPLRRDAPGRRPRARGAFPVFDIAEARDAALEAADRDIYAASSVAPRI